jgi:hypothetical protein
MTMAQTVTTPTSMSVSTMKYPTVIFFHYHYCSESSDFDHDAQFSEYCWFDNNLKLLCGDEVNNEVEIDELIDTFPQDIYINIQACNSADCNTDSVAVRLR